jgi:membrane-bound lytic murein transglycosylase B
VPTPFVDRGTDGGWSYLIEKLVQDGVPRARVERAFHDDRLPSFDGLKFSLRPGESHSMYRGFRSAARLDAARACHEEYADDFARAEKRFDVDQGVIAAIIFVESGCGRNTGRSMIFYRLARLAMANEPANLERNIENLAVEGGVLDEDKAAQARRRARYLEDTFYPEVKAMFEIARRVRIDPLAMRGSGSGAFGYPQFLPSSYVKYAVDGNGDGRISLYDMPDAIASAANYFKQKGWRPGLSEEQQRRVVWEYNRSNPYIDTVLAIASEIDVTAVAQQP